MNNRGIIKVIDITGKMDNYMTLEEFMKNKEYKFRCDFNIVGKGAVSSDLGTAGSCQNQTRLE